MRSIHFRVSDAMYHRIQEEAEDQGVSVAHFVREAALARAAIYAHRRGMRWGDPLRWEALMEIVDEVDRADARVRAESARARRQKPS